MSYEWVTVCTVCKILASSLGIRELDTCSPPLYFGYGEIDIVLHLREDSNSHVAIAFTLSANLKYSRLQTRDTQ